MAGLPAPSAETIRRARLFWEQGGEDLKSARAMLRRKEFLQSSYFSLQGAVNGLSAVCHLHGLFQLPTGGPTQLLALIAGIAPDLANAVGALNALEQVTEHNPFAATEPGDDLPAFSRACLDEGRRVMKHLKAYLKANRARFFAP